MTSSDSMFLFEIAVEELKSFMQTGNYRIRAKFGNVFTLKLRDPNEVYAEALLSKRGSKKQRKLRVRKGKAATQTLLVPTGQTILIASDIESLVANMLKYPIELTLFSKDDPYTLGIVEIPWGSPFMDYVKSSGTDANAPAAMVREKHKLFDEYTSKRVAILTLKIRVNKLIDSDLLQPRYAIDNPFKEFSMGELNPEFARAMTTTRDFDNITYEDTGIIKTIYSSRKRKLKKTGRGKQKAKNALNNEKKVDSNPQSTADEINVIKEFTDQDDDSMDNSVRSNNIEFKNSLTRREKISNSIATLVRSQTHVEKSSKSCLGVTKHWSSTSVEIKERLDTLNYIFGNLDGPFGNKVYCVGYFTIENNIGLGTGISSLDKNPVQQSPSSKSPVQQSITNKSPNLSSTPYDPDMKKSEHAALKGSGKYSFKICGSKCKMGTNNPCFDNICSIDLPEEAAHLISMRKCTEIIACDHKRERPPLSPTDEPIIMDFTNRNTKDCCITQKVEQVSGGMNAKMTVGEDPCYCTCECTFGFVKKTTYCTICGGYEIAGDEVVGTRGGLPFPCPIYHNLAEKGKKGTGSATGDIKAKKQPVSSTEGAIKERGKSKSERSTPEKRSLDKRSFESEKDTKKRKRIKKDDRFKFNYGYKGIPPQIGHSQCAMPCTGNLYPVPKNMGWLWTADNIPGMKVRPNWRPGAANKHVVRMLKIARYPEQVKSKRKKDVGKKKKPLKRPLLIVQKKDGEYTVTMETMRTFNKPRAINQYPYEDKPLVTYTVGRTDEENRERQKRKERQKRRLEKEQRTFIQSAFHDMCKDICLKTYQQALGVLPYTEDPTCPCYPIEPDADRIDLSQSCSCTESTRSSGSATDDDEWIVEFTPPNAYFNPAYITKKIVKVDNSTQYTYLDYRVKLLDRFGNPVPRFFIGPDGKQQCSDLGGFWGPDKKWLEINFDGYIGPDGRWAPNNFIGPCGEHVEGEGGKFQATNGVWLVVGVDGFVTSQGKWCFYPKQKDISRDPKKQRNVHAWKRAGGCKGTGDTKKQAPYVNKSMPSEATWSCFGDASPRTLSQMGIVGHGHDRRLLLSTLEKMMAEGEDVTMPHTPKIPKLPRKKGKKIRHPEENECRYYISDRSKCKHQLPSDKGIVAVDEKGRKTYFTLRNLKNTLPKDRLITLDEKGISLSSFHVPCFSSFITSEAARKQQYEHILQHNARIMQSTGAQIS